MDSNSVFAELLAREPIFHRPQFASTPEHFASMMSENYWEVGASGSIYTRDFILDLLARNPPLDAAAAEWTLANPQCRSLGNDTYLLTYTLHQGERITRRATLWHRTETAWRIIYHQGTIVADTCPISG
jgi:hypothetical protein